MSSAHDFTDAGRGPRLQKVLAEAGIGSRRACEELIESGQVTVNGHMVAELPAWVDPVQDDIRVSGRRLPRAEDHVYIMLFKPRGVVATNDDPEGRRRAIDLIDHPLRPRLFPVGRLDLDSSGLLLLTNDGELANRLTHPRYGVHKAYDVIVRGRVTPEAIETLNRGVYLHDRDRGRGQRTQPAKVQFVRHDGDRTRLRIELREGRNRQVRRMMVELGHPVKKLRRVQMGPLKLKGLQPGGWRLLTQPELRDLKRAAYRDERSGRKLRSGRREQRPRGDDPRAAQDGAAPEGSPPGRR